MGNGLDFSLPPYVESVENQIDDENLLQSMTLELPEIIKWTCQEFSTMMETDLCVPNIL